MSRNSIQMSGVALLLFTGTLVSGCRSDALVFTTYSKVGLHISAVEKVPTGVTFGYKRFEGAIIPVDPTNTNRSPSDLASLYAAMNVKNSWLQGLEISQRFATGDAAEHVAMGGIVTTNITNSNNQ